MSRELKQETLAEIEEELRSGEYAPLADRIHAAWEREKSQSWHHREMEELILRHEKEVAELKKQTGNAAAMREALAAIVAYWDWNGFDAMRESRLKDMARAALAKPPRQCDVGTEQEQQDRFREFCRHYESECECGIGRSEAACPAFQGGRNPDCSLWWAQMPYEEGGAE